ncbi:hypothetical protein IFM89_022797 [Coptis chinensis]|uniref:Calponin-homology (CH) domain-containing protein n=1 Tax=Coptis chinensis TaxID=261450 RepID=A0A835I5I7_9MAGN|nr:hypothetical protein IFM89_022797 [Coptis chinensis]
MSSFVGVHVSDPWLQSQFTQVELRTLNSNFVTLRSKLGKVTVGDLAPVMTKLKTLGQIFSEEEITNILGESTSDMSEEVDFEAFLRAYLNLQAQATGKQGGSKTSSTFLKATTTTLLHTISESEKSSYVAHINSYLGEDPFLKKYLPLNQSTNDLFNLVKDGVLLCKLINVAVPGTIDERAINTKRVLNPWERNENHTLCLNSAKAIGCTVVNIGTQDLIEARPHLVLGLISQIIKIQLLADLNLKKTPQLVELVDDSKDVEELMTLSPEKLLLRWMNFHLKKAGYKRTINNFSSDVKDGEAYAYLLNVLAPEHCSPTTLDTKDPTERAKLILDHAEKMNCKKYITPKDMVEGSPNLNLAFVAHIFHHRWILLEVLDKVSPGAVNWKQASKPPIKMPFRKVENCNQVVRIGKQLKFSLVNVAGNDIVQGNKKLILVEGLFFLSAFLWQLMRFNMLQLLQNLRFHSKGKEMTDADILGWANTKVKSTGRTSQMESFRDKNLSNGIFFLELLSAVGPRVVNWNLVTKGESDEEKNLNATYIISVARKLGCSVFLLPEDIMEVNQKMILTLTASIMYWSLQQPVGPESSSAEAAATPESSSPAPSVHSEDGSTLSEDVSNLTIDDAASDSTPSPHVTHTNANEDHSNGNT